MNYSEALPKRTYSTTIGNFSIVDLCSYYDTSENKIETTKIQVDNTQTLVEKSYQIYGDVNSFWLFLVANKKINPFTLTKQSTTSLLTEDNSIKTIHGSYGGKDIYSTSGSIITPFANTGGSAWQFSYVGNFSLTGGFALVDSFNTFSKRVATKNEFGVTLGFSSSVQPIVKGTTGYYQLDLEGYNGINITSSETKTDVLNEIIYKKSTNAQAYLLLDSELPLLTKGASPYTPDGITAQELTFQDKAQLQKTEIDAFVAYSDGYRSFNLITQKYVI